jgi:hypothetical protein
MVTYSKTKVLSKRVPTVVDFTDNIQRWDSDNFYPQRAIEVVKRASPLKRALSTYADFIDGEGFADVNIAKLIVNRCSRQGEQMNSILRKISKYVAMYKAFVLHFNYDLNYRIASIEVKPIEHFRYGHPDINGVYHHIFHCLNWERDARKFVHNQDRIITKYNLFDPSPAVVAAQIQEAGSIYDYKGQVLFVCENPQEYPLATFDPVWEAAETVAACAVSKISAVNNQFGGTIAIVYPGEFETKEEENTFLNYIEGKSGPENQNSRIGIQDKSGTKKADEIFKQLAPPNVDKMWEYTESSARDQIYEHYAQPKELSGIRPESGMFNQDNMIQAYAYYNSKTRNERNWVSEVLAEILLYWSTPIVTDAKIAEAQYMINGAPAQPTTPPATPPASSSSAPTAQANENIRNMTGRQRQNFKRVLREYTTGKITRQQAEAELSGYGFDAEYIKVWLDPETEPVQ